MGEETIRLINFKKEVHKLAKEIGVEIKEIHLRKMKRKLASCSSKGRLTFDKSLLYESNEKIKEVVLHELLHLRYPNHNKIFKALLKTYISKTTFNL
jgi:predicted metal-dependent hydrolase